jgi:hypothetical protein
VCRVYVCAVSCRALQSQHVVVITWAAAKLGQYCPTLFDRLLWRAVAVRAQLYPQGVGVLLAACAAVGHRPDSKAVAQLVQVGRGLYRLQESANQQPVLSVPTGAPYTHPLSVPLFTFISHTD